MRFCERLGCQQPVFGTCKQSRKGYCKQHQSDRLDFNYKSITQRAIEKHKEQQNKKPKEWFQEVDKFKKAEMGLFWTTAEKELAKHPYCAECGAFIPKQYYRSAIAHVLQKRKEYGFPSVAANQLNRLFLGAACGCHGRYDRSWEDAAKMKVFSIAIEIFKKLYPFIHKSERKNIPEILMQEIEPEG